MNSSKKVTEASSFPAPLGLRVTGVEVAPRLETSPVRVIHPDQAFEVTLAPSTPGTRGWQQLRISFPARGTVDLLAQISFDDDKDFWLRVPANGRNEFAAYIRCTGALTRIKLLISGSGCLLQPTQIALTPVDPISWALRLLSRVPHVVRRDGMAAFAMMAQAIFRLSQQGSVVMSRATLAKADEEPYDTWIRLFDEAPETDRPRHLQRLEQLRRRPTFTVVAIGEEVDLTALNRLTKSLREQVYPQWQLLVAVPEPALSKLRDLIAIDSSPQNIHVVAREEDLAATRNKLVDSATGEFLILMPATSILRPHALLELALTLEAYPEATLIYTDEDELARDGRRRHPSFKPAWSPDLFDVSNYFGSLVSLRRDVVALAGGWRADFGQAADYDLMLRLVDIVDHKTIVHLAEILIHNAQTVPVVPIPQHEKNKIAIEDHIRRKQVHADVVWSPTANSVRIKYHEPEPNPLISLIILTRDRSDMLQTCVDSIILQTRYAPYEIIIVDNGSREPETHALFEKLRAEHSVRVLPRPGPFNFSALNNAAARVAKGSILGLLNNDVEVKDGQWLTELVSLSARDEIGCVGCKLLYSDGRIQHAGVYLGLGGIAGHGFRFAANDDPGYLERLLMVHNVSAVTAACLFVRKTVFEEVGGLDEKDLGVAYNDADFCLKVRAAGYLNLWTPFAELIHYESASRGRDFTPAKARRYRSEVNALRRRWGRDLFFDPYYSPHLTNDREDFSIRVR
jgi:GT2 family glycosyltransferase